MRRRAKLAMAALLGCSVAVLPARADQPAADLARNYLRVFAGFLALPPLPANSYFESANGYIDYDLIALVYHRLGGAIGRDLGAILSLEVEFSVARAPIVLAIIPGEEPLDLTNVDRGIRVLSLVGNAVIGHSFGPLRPYLALGAGAARVHLDLGLDVVDDHAITWTAQAMAGIDLALSPALSIGGRYRFQLVGPTTYSDFTGDPFYLRAFGAHSIETALTIRF